MGDNTNPYSGINTTTVTSPQEGDILIYDGSDSYDSKALSGDATITKDGVITVTNASNIQGHTIGGSASGDFVTIGASQTILNKTLTAPLLNSPEFNESVTMSASSTPST